jgi:hypothetical protein
VSPRRRQGAGWVSITGLLGTFWLAAPEVVRAECRILCSPSLKIEPTLTRSNLFGGPRLRRLSDGTVHRQAGTSVFERILAVDVPTRWRRLALVAETIWTPFERENELEVELEANLKWLLAEQTGGWVASHFDIVDKFSPAERTGDVSAYTHELNFELDTAVTPFRALRTGHWLRDVEIEASLDFVVTGLPRAGDEVSGGVFLDDASGWSLSLVLVIPLAPR